MAVTAALFLAGALTSAVGIRNPPRADNAAKAADKAADRAPDSQAPPPVDS